MMTHDTTNSNLPREMGNGLLMRQAAAADAEELAAFNVAIHSGDPQNPEMALGHWTRDLLSGRHPTVQPEDFTVVVDQNRGSKIVSSLVLISQTWAYEDVILKVGRPELVGTDPEYRRKGLIKAQFDVIHAWSAARGEALQGITGIPHYYRQFGYEMALNLGGGRSVFWHRVKALGEAETEKYRLRPATCDDIPLLARLYEIHCAASLIRTQRSEAEWRWMLNESHPQSLLCPHFEIIEDLYSNGLGFIDVRLSSDSFYTHDIAVLPNYALRDVCLFLVRALKARAEEQDQTRSKPLQGFGFSLGEAHPVYDALDDMLDPLRPPYAWYIRVPDLAAFLRQIAPVLERRLEKSVLTGHTGNLRLNFYRRQMMLSFTDGRLTDIGTYSPTYYHDGDACFPDLTFLHLLMGHRSLKELRHAFTDCFANDEATLLLNILFPKSPSNPSGLG